MSITTSDFRVLLVSGFARQILKKNVMLKVLETCIMFYSGLGFHVEILPFQFSCIEDQVERQCHPQSWSNCEGTTFEVRRGPNYVDGQKKKSKPALYTIFKIDGYKTPFKMHSMWKYIHPNFDQDFRSEIKKYSIPRANGQKYPYKLPPMLILNVMIPNYAPMMGKKAKKDGDGYVLLLYCHLSDATYKKLDKFTNSKAKRKLPMSPAIKLLSKFMGDKVLQKQRFKIMARIMNGKYSKIGFVGKQLINKYNAKPFLARKSTTFYYEANKYFAVDIDIHEFGYPAKKGLDLVKDTTTAIYDVGMVIEGATNNELPEQILISFRMSKLAFKDLCKDINRDIPRKYLNDHS